MFTKTHTHTRTPGPGAALRRWKINGRPGRATRAAAETPGRGRCRDVYLQTVMRFFRSTPTLRADAFFDVRPIAIAVWMQPDSIQRRPRGLFGFRAQARAPFPSLPVPPGPCVRQNVGRRRRRRRPSVRMLPLMLMLRTSWRWLPSARTNEPPRCLGLRPYCTLYGKIVDLGTVHKWPFQSHRHHLKFSDGDMEHTFLESST